MNTEQIKKLLHHREPYLMVSEVLDITPYKITTVKNHTADDFYLRGHFPGAPVIPGAMLQEFSTQSAGILITKFHSPVENYDSEITKGWALGVLNKVELAKFFKMTGAHAPIKAVIELLDKQDTLFKFRSSIYQDGVLKAKMKFNLVNISDEYLKI